MDSSIPDSLSPIDLPSVLSLVIDYDMRYFQVPRLWFRFRRLHEYDWRKATSNLLGCISLRIEMPLHKQGNMAPVFELPHTDCLNISSPYVPLPLFLAELVPQAQYSLC